MADLKTIAKTIKGQQALACEFYETGNLDAMYLAGICVVELDGVGEDRGERFPIGDKVGCDHVPGQQEGDRPGSQT